MEKIRIGAVTIGQSPRTDITADASRFWGDRVELLEFGALDRFSEAEAARLDMVPGDYILTSRLRGGTEVRLSRSLVVDELQRGIHWLEAQGVQLILVLCTGDLGELHASVPLLEPNHLLQAVAPCLTSRKHILLLAPSREQVRQSEARWKKCLPSFDFSSFAASPYNEDLALEEAARQIEQVRDADLLIMDCLGFSCRMRDDLRSMIHKNILLPRALLFQMAAELLGI